MQKEREFQFSHRDFDRIRQIVARQTGIKLSDAKKDMVYSRLVRRLRHLKLDSFSNYCSLLQEEEADSGEELMHFTNAITTNLTSFFREPHHFEYLANVVIPDLLRKNATSKRIRIWSAGCSTGEEPYSIAMTVCEALPAMRQWDVKILATDLDTNVLHTATQGIYSLENIDNVGSSRLRQWFLKGGPNHPGKVRVKPEIRSLVTFKQLNLMHDWPIRGPFDLIFCRNVVIYFTKTTQGKLVDRYAEILHPDGHLFMGHSEALYKVSNRFKLIGKTVYRRVR